MWWKLPERALGSADLVQPLHFSGEGEETPERLLLAQGHRPFLLFLKKLESDPLTLNPGLLFLQVHREETLRGSWLTQSLERVT